MKRALAVAVLACMLLGTGIASIAGEPQAYPQGMIGTRAGVPGMPVNANITDNTTWDNLIYDFIYIRQDIWVDENRTLTILPGVTVRFDPGTSLHVRGQLIADGAPFQNISFIPYSSNPSPMHWDGISLENSTGPCTFDNVLITFSQYGIANFGSEANVTNSRIETTYYFAILAGVDSQMRIYNNYLYFNTWAGIITDNRTSATVERNYMKTSNYGIVCYDKATVRWNYMETCWLGILAWGDALISHNQIYKCIDGIHAFFSAPIIESNSIRVCDGNGTRFLTSNAIMRNNTFTYNNVGIDLDYESRHLLETMVNNKVNGIDIRSCFFVGKRNLEIDGLKVDSGWSNGYYGSLTAQGSVTLYDCRNVTIKDCKISNSMNLLFATNSTFTIMDSTLSNSFRSQVFLEANATGTSFNRSVDPDSVIIAGDNCLFQTFDGLTIQVLDFNGTPILGARVIVKEGLLVLHDAITGINGQTGNLITKDRTVSEAGVIFTPLIIEVIIDGYNFDPNPATGIKVNQTSFVSFRDLGDIFPPTVVNQSVQDGDREFPTDGSIMIMFSEPMNRESVESSFSITGNVSGTFTWQGNNLTFTPSNLEPNVYYTIVISTGAKDLWNNTLASPYSVSFTTKGQAADGGSTLIIVMISIFAAAGIGSWYMVRKMRK